MDLEREALYPYQKNPDANRPGREAIYPYQAVNVRAALPRGLGRPILSVPRAERLLLMRVDEVRWRVGSIAPDLAPRRGRVWKFQRPQTRPPRCHMPRSVCEAS